MDEDELFELQYHDEMEMLAELDNGNLLLVMWRTLVRFV